MQAIYGFRGAAQDGMGMMRPGELNADKLGLTTTYRCPKSVVAHAAKIVPDYHAAPSAPDGSVKEVGRDWMTSNAAVGDAILSRLNAPLMPAVLRFLREGKPARVEGRDIGKQLSSLSDKQSHLQLSSS